MNVYVDFASVDDFFFGWTQLECENEYASCPAFRHNQPIELRIVFDSVEIGICDVCWAREAAELQIISLDQVEKGKLLRFFWVQIHMVEVDTSLS